MLKKLFYLVLSINVLAGCHKDNDDKNPLIGENFTETVSGVSFDMVYVKGGTFQMGAAEDDEDAYDFEKPAHSVTLSDYYIGKYEVTQGLWKAVMGEYPSYIDDVGDNYPMYYIGWKQSSEFCIKLSQLTGRKYVLPTEAQWEYAARGGEKSQGYKYSGSNNIDEVAWYDSNMGKEWHVVGSKKANELGIFDMSGEMAEWCQDWFASDYYANSPQIEPVGPETGTAHVLRGGDWKNVARRCRVSSRRASAYNDTHCGLRVVLIP